MELRLTNPRANRWAVGLGIVGLVWGTLFFDSVGVTLVAMILGIITFLIYLRR
jgi:hypothetical protein